MSQDRQERFAAHVDALAAVVGHADRAAPLRDYCPGLLLPGGRRSIVLMQFESTPQTRNAIGSGWPPSVRAGVPSLFPGRSQRQAHLSTRQ